MVFVYIIDRDGEFDVFSDLADAREAAETLGIPYVEQAVFESSTHPERAGSPITRGCPDRRGSSVTITPG